MSENSDTLSERCKSNKTFNFDYELELKGHTQKSNMTRKLSLSSFNNFQDIKENISDSQCISYTPKRQTQQDFYIISNNSWRTTEKQNNRPRNDYVNQKQEHNSPKFLDSDKYFKSSVKSINKFDLKIDLDCTNRENQSAEQKQIENKTQLYKVPDKAYEFTSSQLFNNYSNTIKFLTNKNEAIEYQTFHIEKQIEQLETELMQSQFNCQLLKIRNSISEINSNISKERNLSRCLEDQMGKRKQQFQNSCLQISSIQFERPLIIKDQAKALIQSINQLKRQFISLQRDEGPLNFVQTQRYYRTPSLQRGLNQQQTECNEEQVIFQEVVKQIKKADLQMKQPKYIQNIKMCLVKEDWIIYQNQEICVHFNSKNYPTIFISIRNKKSQYLAGLSIKQNNILAFQNLEISSKSVYIYEQKYLKYTQPFQKLTISYYVKRIKRQDIILFVPKISLKFGDFLPITLKQFNSEYLFYENQLQAVKSSSPKQLDSKIIINGSIRELLLYYPNLIFQQNTQQDRNRVCKGLFQLYNEEEGILIIIKQKQKLFTIELRNQIPFLIHMIEFLLQAI